MRSPLHVAAVVILAVGLTAGVAVYLLAEDEEQHLAIYEMQVSKRYARELERFGGKAALLFDDFNRWFAARWQGKQLGVTIIVLAAGVSLALYLIARRD